MGHPYRKPPDLPAPPRDAMLPVLVAVGVLAFAGAAFAIGFGVWDAHHAPPVAQPAPVPTPTVAWQDPVVPPPVTAWVNESPIPSSRPSVFPSHVHRHRVVRPVVHKTDDGPTEPWGGPTCLHGGGLPGPMEEAAGPKPTCPAGTYAKVGMLGHWGCCPNGADCD